MTQHKRIDKALESILLAGGFSFKHITSEESLNAMRQATLDVMKKSYIEGVNANYRYRKQK